MNNFEKAIAEILVETKFNYADDITPESIAPEACRTAIVEYCGSFAWDNDAQLNNYIECISGRFEDVPGELVYEACRIVWSQTNWEAIAQFVRENLDKTHG